MNYIRSRADEEALKCGYRFDQVAASKAVAFFKRHLTIFDKPFVPLPWQEQVIGELHGWKDPQGLFRFKWAYINTAKKSGKTELNSGLSLLHLVGKYEACG